MSQKIILLIDSRISGSNKKPALSSDSFDTIFFQRCDELPRQFDSNLYHGILLKTSRISEELFDYLEELHEGLVDQTLYVIGQIADGPLYTRTQKLANLYIFEPSDFDFAQLQSLGEKLLRAGARLRDARFYRKRYQTLINASPFNVITVNAFGKILEANRSFLKTFNYSAPYINDTHLSSYIPTYSFDEIIKFSERASMGQSHHFQTTFLEHSGKLVPVDIHAFRSNHSKDLHLILIDKSEILAYKRTVEYQQRAFDYFNQLIQKVLQAPSSSGELLDESLLKKIYSADQVLECKVSRDSENNRLFFDKSTLGREQEAVFNVFEKMVSTSIRTQEKSVLHFAGDNPGHAEYLNYAQTIVVLPVYFSGHIRDVVVLLYANRYEPDEVASRLFEVLIFLLRFKYMLLEQRDESNQGPYKEILENALDGIYRSTIDGKLIYANPAFVKMLEYDSLNEMRNLDIARVLYDTGEERERFVEQVRERPAVQNLVARLKTKTGKTITALEHARMVKHADGPAFIEGVIRDISEGEVLKDQLRKSRRFTDELVDEAGVIIVAEKMDSGECIIWNKKAESVFGIPRSETLNNSHYKELLYTDANYRNYVSQEAVEFAIGSSQKPVEFQAFAGENRKKIISWTYIIVDTDEQGKVLVGFGNDITDMRMLEKRFIETQRMEFFSTLTTVLADQFKDIVSAMALDLEQLSRAFEKKQNPERSVTSIEQKLREANRLLERMRSHADTTQTHPNAMIEPNQIIEQAITLLEKTIPDSINIVTRFKASRYVRISEAHFNQVLFNLALNAVNAMKDGGEIVIETKQCNAINEPFLISNNAVDEEYVKIIFNDNGAGMDEITRQRIFEPFFSTTSTERNKGLGATLVYNIVRRYNGYIDVESQVGRGTSVIIYLPVIEQAATQKPARSKESVNGNILVVDDSKEIREILRDIANADGYHTYLAEDGLEGLELFKQHMNEIDLAILDIIMPKLDGRDLFFKIRELKPDIKILVTSGYSKPEVKKELLANRVDGFLPKPFNVKSVRERLKELLLKDV